VLGYSSVAQLGFILLGVSSLDPAGAQGAILQSITHALVVVPAFVLVAVVSERAGGVDQLDRLGGLARRAPVLAAAFLVVALCWLALPGTGNFVGEYLNLLGQWRVAPWATIVGSIGIALAAVYVLRMMITIMQNRQGPAVDDDAPDLGRRDGLMLGVTIAALLVLSLVPQLALKPSDTASRTAVEPARALFDSQRKAEQAESAPDAAALQAAGDAAGSSQDSPGDMIR
jgi:NADH-quinone oxidoreductase subunit M